MTIARAVIPNVHALIMAGGRGQRFYPLTASRPEPAIPVGGVSRIVDFTLSNCLNSGLSRYRGTADAVFQNIAALRQRRPEFVLILSGDQVYYMDYRELLRHHAETKSSVLMSGVRVGKDTRIRHAIIEEGVHIPAGFQIGFDLENDRKH